MSKRILVVYATHNINDNLLYFLRHGIIDDPNIQYYISFNGAVDTTSINHIQKNNVKFHQKPDIGADFNTWSSVLFLKNSTGAHIYTDFNYYIFINNTCRGPFVPFYVKERWVDIFINQINDTVKLVGPTINYYHGTMAHVQSYCFCLDRIGLDIYINHNILAPGLDELYKKWNYKTDTVFKHNFIMYHEIGGSKWIMQYGYNIASFQKAFQGIDFRKHKEPVLKLPFGKTFTDNALDNAYFGTSIHPYEVIFFKANRDITPTVLDKFTQFHESKI